MILKKLFKEEKNIESSIMQKKEYQIESKLVSFTENEKIQIKSFKVLSYDTGNKSFFFLIKNDDIFIKEFINSYEQYLRKKQWLEFVDSSYNTLSSKIKITIWEIFEIDSLIKYAYSWNKNPEEIKNRLLKQFIPLKKNCLDYLNWIVKNRDYLVLEENFYDKLDNLLMYPNNESLKEFFNSYYIKDSFFAEFSLRNIIFNKWTNFQKSEIVFKLLPPYSDSYLETKKKLTQRDIFTISKSPFIKYSIYTELNNNFDFYKRKDKNFWIGYYTESEILTIINQQKISNANLYYSFFNEFLPPYTSSLNLSLTEDKSLNFNMNNSQEELKEEKKRKKQKLLKLKETLLNIKWIKQFVYNKKYKNWRYIEVSKGYESIRRKMKHFSYNIPFKIFLKHLNKDIIKWEYLSPSFISRVNKDFSEYSKWIKKELEPDLGALFYKGTIENMKFFTGNKDLLKLSYEFLYKLLKDKKHKVELIVNSPAIETELISFYELVESNPDKIFGFYSSQDFKEENLRILSKIAWKEYKVDL